MSTSNTATLSLRSVLEKDELDETNFLDMFENLSVDPKHERKGYLIDQPIPDEPATDDPRDQTDADMKHQDDSMDTGCLMPPTMVPDLD